MFTKPSVTDYVSMPVHYGALSAVTGCIWIRTYDTYNFGTVWSYAAESNWLSADDANVFTLYDYGNVQVGCQTFHVVPTFLWGPDRYESCRVQNF